MGVANQESSAENDAVQKLISLLLALLCLVLAFLYHQEGIRADRSEASLLEVQQHIIGMRQSFRAASMDGDGDLNNDTPVHGREDMDTSQRESRERKEGQLNARLKELLTEDQFNALMAARSSEEKLMDNKRF